MASESKVTTDHNEIRKWAEARGGKPATVKATGDSKGAGLLRIDYPGYRGKQSLEEISWDELFSKFEEKKLAFLYQDETATGKVSRFSKFISRERSGRDGGGRSKDGDKKDSKQASGKAENKKADGKKK